jgi:hypothetical protein
VIDGEGHSVAGALVSVVWGTAPTPETGRWADPEGCFVIGLSIGERFRVRATTADGRAGEADVDGSAFDEIVVRVTKG